MRRIDALAKKFYPKECDENKRRKYKKPKLRRIYLISKKYGSYHKFKSSVKKY